MRIFKKIVDQKNINDDFGRKFKIVTKSRTSYHAVALYCSDYYTTTETYEEKIYLDEKEKAKKKNQIS